tara:strand:- start:468 stop:863 length:396 start_codon:yes stop_codon:yes gene_type:complete
MRENGFNLGGEQSGHIILGDYSTTGDGLIAALQVLAILVGKKKNASEVCKVFDPLPQILKNITCDDVSLIKRENVQNVIDRALDKLGTKGRVLVRPSGTEAVVRVMVEGEDNNLIKVIADEIIESIGEGHI